MRRLFFYAALGVGYFALMMLALQLAVFGSHYTPLWPAAGLGVAGAALLGPPAAVAAFLGKALGAVVGQHFPGPMAAVVSLSGLSEALVGAWVLRRLTNARADGPTPNLASPLGLLVGAAAAGAASATCGVLPMLAFGLVPEPTPLAAWLAWWASNTLGTLTVTPLVLRAAAAWQSRGRTPPEGRSWGREALALLLALGLLAGLFLTPRPLAAAFVLFPLLVWTGGWCRPVVTELLVLGVALSGALATVARLGPFGNGDLTDELLNFQLFALAFVVSGHFLAHLGTALRRRLPAAVCLVGWAATATVVLVVDHHKSALDDTVMSSEAAQVQDALRDRFEQSLVAPLRHGSRMLTRSGRADVTTEGWQAFVEDLEAGPAEPWLIGLSVLTAEGRPLGFARRGTSALALALADLPPELRQAALQARTTGRAQLSPWRGAPAGPQTYVLFVPLGSRAAPRGWLGATIDLGGFLRSVDADPQRQLELMIVDASAGAAGPPLLGRAAFERRLDAGPVWRGTFALANAPLEARWRRGEGFVSHRDFAAMGIGAVAALLSLALTLVVASLQSVGERARELATRMTAELAERERLWQTLAETVPGGILQADAGGGTVYVNPRGAELLGLAPAAALDQGWLAGVHPDDRDGVTRAWQTLIAGGTFDVQFRTLRHATIDTWVAGSGVATRAADGQATGFLAVLQDVSELKKQQRELVARSKMSSLGEMAGGIAHEINNPLMIIQAMADQMRRSLDRLDLERARKISEQIDGTVHRIAKIISGLRAFARNAERDPLAPATIGSIVDATLGLCAQRFQVRGVRVKVDGELDATLDCRAVQLSQVLLNLLNNSYDAIERLDTKWIDIAARSCDEKVVLTVTDSGRRIPDDVAAKIMQPFFTTKPVGRGTGLGLSISKGIVEDHGGSLALDGNCPNTRFVVTLPRTGEPRVP